MNAAAIVQSRPLPRGKQDAESSVQPAAISVSTSVWIDQKLCRDFNNI